MCTPCSEWKNDQFGKLRQELEQLRNVMVSEVLIIAFQSFRQRQKDLEDNRKVQSFNFDTADSSYKIIVNHLNNRKRIYFCK